ncbi:MAG: metallophosphoesterase [bacterium]
MSLVVLATTDLHGERAPELARLAREGPGAAILVDNGDAFGGAAGLRFSLEGGACGTVEWMNSLGLAALNVGNHDLDQGVEGLLARAQQARFAILSANLFEGDRRLLPDRVVVDSDAGAVGIAGAITPAAGILWPPSLRRRLRVTDPVAALRRCCEALRPRCRFVIALAHLGFPLLPELAEENPGEELLAALGITGADGRPLADCVVLGHTHLEHAEVRGSQAVLMPGRRAEAVGRARLGGDVEAEVHKLSGTPAERLQRADPRLQAIQVTERERLARLLARALPVGSARTFGEQLLAAARRRGADGIVVAQRVGTSLAPARTLGEALPRAPMLEPLVLLGLSAPALRRTLVARDRHAVRAELAGDPQAARRHRWHAFELLGGSGGGPYRLLVPASWTGGYAGYEDLSSAPILAEPGDHLLELLL